MGDGCRDEKDGPEGGKVGSQERQNGMRGKMRRDERGRWNKSGGKRQKKG